MSRAGRHDPYYDDYPPPAPRRRRDYEEVDVDIRERSARRPPDYLREDYGAQQAGPLVRREGRSRKDEEIEIDIRERDGEYSRPKPRRRAVEKEDIEIDIRREDSRGPPPRRNGDDDREIVFRRGEGDRAPPRRSREDVDIDIREEENRGPRRRREASREKITIDIREDERSRPPPRPISRAVSRAPPPKSRAGSDEELDIRFSHRDDKRGHQDKIVIRERSNSRERSRPAPRPYAREREDFVYRRREPSPPSPQQDTREEIIIRRRRSPSPSPVREPSPELPAPEPPIVRPPIVQEIITHHRGIDHGLSRAPPSPESSPSPPRRRDRHDDIDIDIRRTDARGNVYEEDIRIHEDDRRDRRREREDDRQLVRARSAYREPIPEPPPPRSRREETNVNINIDGDFGNSDRRVGRPLPPPEPRAPELWTEFTKDLINREGIRAMGLEFEETDEYFYILERLSEGQVRRLVDISEDFTYGRRDRIEQIQWERKDPRLPKPREIREPRRLRGGPEPPDGWEEVVYERERIYEDGPRGPRRIR